MEVITRLEPENKHKGVLSMSGHDRGFKFDGTMMLAILLLFVLIIFIFPGFFTVD